MGASHPTKKIGLICARQKKKEKPSSKGEEQIKGKHGKWQGIKSVVHVQMIDAGRGIMQKTEGKRNTETWANTWAGYARMLIYKRDTERENGKKSP